MGKTATVTDGNSGDSAGKIAIVTDSNSGISQAEGENLGISVIPMPFSINEETFYEDVNLTVPEFYNRLAEGANVITSQPSPEAVRNLWNRLLKTHDEVVHIPMSSGLSGSCESAVLLSREYGGRVQVADNRRISVSQRQSALDAVQLAQRGKSAAQIKELLEEDCYNSSIYIMLDTLYYLKKGGRITPAAAALGTLLKIKPVLQIQGDRLDAFAKARTTYQGKSIMLKALQNDIRNRFGGLADTSKNLCLYIAHTQNEEASLVLKKELEDTFPGCEVDTAHLPLSIACHIGPGSLAVACCKRMDYDRT
ncbi:MAG: DegV family protein [Clostridium sp.]|jgi:DegV family protein with EDD domain|nr:DegV family protein [Clostridium sp.]